MLPFSPPPFPTEMVVSGLSQILDVKLLNRNGDGVHERLCASKDAQQ